VHGGMQKAKLSKYHTFLPSNIFQPGTPTWFQHKHKRFCVYY
jgi:hypothetical protein